MSDEPRAKILQLIPERLRFLALIMLVMEAGLISLIWALPIQYRAWLVGAIVVFLLIFVFIALYIEVRMLNAGTWLLPYAALFAVDLIDVLDGYLANLPTAEQQEAWDTLSGVLLEFEDPEAPPAYLKFRTDVAMHIRKKKPVTKRIGSTQGPITD